MCEQLGRRHPDILTQQDLNDLQYLEKLVFPGKGYRFVTRIEKMENGTWVSLRTGSTDITSVITWGPDHPVKQYKYAAITNKWDKSVPTVPMLRSMRPWDGNQLLCISDDPADFRFTVKVLGLCKETNFKREYDYIFNKYYFVSERNHTLKRQASKTWALQNNDDRKGEAKITGVAILPLGTFDVKLENDPCTDGKDDKSVKITITNCKDDQFTCISGHCVSMELRCNRISDCSDSSDEKDCAILKIDKTTYIREYPPIVVDENYEPIKVSIDISLDIEKILSIDEIEGIFSVAFQLHTVWFDKRLTFMNLKESSSLNTLTEVEKTDIWSPTIVFSNTKFKDKVKTDDRVIAKVSRRGNWTASSRTEPLRTLYYRGEDNPIMFSRKYTINFLCEYDMAWYPFDLQRCELNFEPFGNSGDYVVFINKEINYYDKIDLSKYYIKQWQFVSVKKRGKGVVEGLSI